MSLPVSSSRRIVVGERSYRWTVTRVEKSSAESSWAVLVQAEASPGRVLAVELQWECEGMLWFLDGVGAATPGRIRTLIERGCALGWDPAEPGAWLWTHVGRDTLEKGRRAVR
jgi:hypothetical protein